MTPEQVNMIVVGNASEKEDVKVQKKMSKDIRKIEKRYKM